MKEKLQTLNEKTGREKGGHSHIKLANERIHITISSYESFSEAS